MGQDVEDVKVLASGRDSHFLSPIKTSALQIARNALLSQSSAYSGVSNQQKEVITNKSSTSPGKRATDESYQSVKQLSFRSNTATMTPPSRKLHGSYQCVEQLSSEDCTERLSRGSSSRCDGVDAGSPRRSSETFVAPGKVAHMERIQAGKRYLVFRRLYSELEREQARKRRLQSRHSRRVEALKEKKEANRRRIEEATNPLGSSSVVSTSVSEDQQAADEWAELMLLEDRKQQLQKAKEMERYLRALKARLREQIEMKKVDVPPLCSCGKTIWDSSPETCANNCFFYRNTKGM